VLLTTSEHGRLRVLGVNPCAGVRCTWIPDGDCPGNLSLGRHTGDGKSDGETFLGRTWMFFLGESGGEEKLPGHSQQGRSLDDTRFQTAPFCYILYVDQWGFRFSMSSGHREVGPRSSIALDNTCLFRFRQPVDLVHVLKKVKGLLLPVSPRTPRNSGYDVYSHVVYVVICYMSITCYVLYVCCMLYVCYMSSARGGSRVRLYII
jgi:hypothetical protein